MKTNLIKKSIAAAALFGFVLTAGVTPSIAGTTGNDSDRMMLAAGGKLGLNGKAHGVPRAPAGTVKPPKAAKPPKAVKPPKVVDSGVLSEMMLAKSKPANTPVDAPIKNAPHPLGGIHG